MAKFWDALTGRYRELHLSPVKEKKVVPSAPSCLGSKYGHSFSNIEDDASKCRVCGASSLYVRTLRNIKP